jgi:hypothetical protein
MAILKYGDYISEKAVYEILLESKVIYSKKLINLLNKMRANKIATELLNLYSKDVDGIAQNYIDITDQKDSVSFTPDRKVQELTKDKPETWVITESGKYLTTSDRNNKIFEALGYDKVKYNCWSPNTGEIGLILAETVSATSGKIYVMFKEYEGERIGVINKAAMEPKEAEDQRIWSTSRNNIKIGRFVRALLSSAKITVTDPELEQFTNLYKASYDFAKDALKQFDIVKGGKIAYWYDNNDEDRYVDGGGSLNSSCMAEVSSDYFDIYTENPQVSLVILYGDSGAIKDGKYTDDRIKGRAILWDCKLDGMPIKFMDRIYTTLDADAELFKQFAEKNGWWFKKRQSMEPNEDLTDGNSVRKGTIEVKLDDADFGEYPYCDTICYIDSDTGMASNKYWDDSDRMLRDTGGSYEDSYDMEN